MLLRVAQIVVVVGVWITLVATGNVVEPNRDGVELSGNSSEIPGTEIMLVGLTREVAMDGGLDSVYRRPLLVIESRFAAQRTGKICGSDVDGLQPLHRENVVEIVEGRTGLDHGEGDHGVIGVLVIVGTGVERGPNRSESLASRGVPLNG